MPTVLGASRLLGPHHTCQGQPGKQGWVQACGKCRARLLKRIKLRASHLHLRGTKGTGGTSGRTEEQEREKKSERGRKKAGKWAEKRSALQHHWGRLDGGTRGMGLRRDYL